MKHWSRRLPLAVAAMALVGLGGVALVNRAAAQATMTTTSTKGKTAGEFFKNVTTTSLKGLTVDD